MKAEIVQGSWGNVSLSFLLNVATDFGHTVSAGGSLSLKILTAESLAACRQHPFNGDGQSC